ncbi:hypothetical protein K7G98_36760, partial [Saccharothrix sp. MB29]|nr:hypothetical protein [Saccharothrix sp. MB29]
FRAYLAWLADRDRRAARAAWRAALSGLTAPSLVAPQASHRVDGLPGQTWFELSEADSAAVDAVARRCGVTVNTVFQTVWAVVVSRLTGAAGGGVGGAAPGPPPGGPPRGGVVGGGKQTQPGPGR